MKLSHRIVLQFCTDNPLFGLCRFSLSVLVLVLAQVLEPVLLQFYLDLKRIICYQYKCNCLLIYSKFLIVKLSHRIVLQFCTDNPLFGLCRFSLSLLVLVLVSVLVLVLAQALEPVLFQFYLDLKRIICYQYKCNYLLSYSIFSIDQQ